LEKILNGGRARTIGVSIYTVRHMKELLHISMVVPAVNQVEFSPFLYQRDLLEFCRKQRIQLGTYAPLTAGRRIHDPRIPAITAQKQSCTNAEPLLCWVR